MTVPTAATEATTLSSLKESFSSNVFPCCIGQQGTAGALPFPDFHSNERHFIFSSERSDERSVVMADRQPGKDFGSLFKPPQLSSASPGPLLSSLLQGSSSHLTTPAPCFMPRQDVRPMTSSHTTLRACCVMLILSGRSPVIGQSIGAPSTIRVRIGSLFYCFNLWKSFLSGKTLLQTILNLEENCILPQVPLNLTWGGQP